MILTLWRQHSGRRQEIELPARLACHAWMTHSLLIGEPKVRYYRVTLEDSMRRGHFILDSDKKAGIV